MQHIKNLFPLLLLVFVGCDLTKEVEIDLPEYERKAVVECYLEPGKPFRLLLTQSYGFFDPFNLDSNFLQNTLLEGALVTISYDGRTDTLRNQLSFEFGPLKLFNYTGTNIVPATPWMTYSLNVSVPDGRTVSGSAIMLPLVPIDSVRVEWSADRDTLARMLTYIADNPTQENFYRRLLNYGSLDSFPEQDFLVSDRLNTTPLIAFGTGYEIKEGDTVFNTIMHISREHYNFVESVQLAIFGNVNPFSQPSPIKSNVQGNGDPLGIFTCLVYDRDTTIVKK